MSLFKKLHFIKKEKENGDIYTLFFKKPANFKHKAGQHGIFIIPGFYKPHPFTLSSSPDEKYVSFATHVDTGSKYKQKLMTMTESSSIVMLGPIMDFTFVEGAEKYVFLAQGIGITPFRSMLLDSQANLRGVNTTLIHVDSKGHAFKDLTEKYATNAYYPTSADEFRAHITKFDHDQLFYLSGSPKFVNSTKELLTKQGVPPRNIKTDTFLGY